MAKNQILAFGDYSIEIGTASTKHDRDVKTIYVDEQNEHVTMGGVPRSTASRQGGRPLAPGVQKAVRIGDDVIRIPDGALDNIVALSKEANEVMEVLETIDYRLVPTERIVGSKWVTPRGDATGLSILTHSLERTRRVAVVKWLETSREKLGVLRPRKTSSGLALLLIELSFANEYAEPPAEALLDEIPTVASQLAAGMMLIKMFARPRGGEPMVDTASDTAVDMRLALVESLRPSITDALDAAVIEHGEHELV